MVVSVRIPIVVSLIGFASALFAVSLPAAAQDNTCQYAFDGICDESFGTNLCEPRTDTWDCFRTGPQPGPESCPWSRDGVCDEPDGAGYCIPHTDTADCRAEGIDSNRVFYGHDDRIWPASTEMPWRAIGRITFKSEASCTGSLVGPDIVLTAAHCLFADDGDGPKTYDRPLEFIAGASGPDDVARAKVTNYVVPAQFDINAWDSSSRLDGYDWAFLKLDNPIGNETGWLKLAPLTEDELMRAVAGDWFPVMQGGYSADSLSFISANLDCAIVHVFDDNTFFHECDALEGDSGSPLFVDDGSGYRVIGVFSSRYRTKFDSGDNNMAVDARAFWETGRQWLSTAGGFQTETRSKK